MTDNLRLTHTEPAMCISGFSEQQLKQTANAGFSFVEVNFSELAGKTEAQMDKYLALLAKYRLTPIAANCFFGGNLGAFFDGSFDLGKLREYIAQAFETTRKLHFESIAFGSGYMRRIPEGYDRDRAKDFFVKLIADEIVPMLEKYDARLNIEELQTTETNFINSCREAAAIAQAVHHERVGILCDFFHMTKAGEAAADVPSFATYVGHVHLASPTSGRCMPFAQDGDDASYRAFFQALAESGYTHRFSVEGGVAQHHRFPTALRQCHTYLCSLLAPYDGGNVCV